MRRNRVRPEAERFWEKVDIRGPNECWPWKGALDKGYGLFRRAPQGDEVKGRHQHAHVVAWELTKGRKIPQGRMGCHRCDYPACCNPAHTYPGTAWDNMRDKMVRGRGRKTKLSRATIARIKSSSLGLQAAADKFGLSRAWIYKIRQGALG